MNAIQQRFGLIEHEDPFMDDYGKFRWLTWRELLAREFSGVSDWVRWFHPFLKCRWCKKRLRGQERTAFGGICASCEDNAHWHYEYECDNSWRDEHEENCTSAP